MLVFHLAEEVLGDKPVRSVFGFREGTDRAVALAFWRTHRYHPVAYVKCDTTAQAFSLTNHIDRDWAEGKDVWASAGAHRSTSVGDIVVDDDGMAYLCAPIGWTLVGKLGQMK